MKLAHTLTVKGRTMTTNYDRKRRQSLPTFLKSRIMWTPIVIVCMSALVMCGCGKSNASVVATRWSGAEVAFLPVLKGGIAGWCITVTPGGGCQITRLMRGPIIGEFWVGEDDRESAEGFAVTTSAVAAVAVDQSKPIATSYGSLLPQGLKAVAVKVYGRWAPYVKRPSLFGRPPHMAPARLPQFTPLDPTGMPLEQSDKESAFVERELAGRSWSRPAREPPGACELLAIKFHGLVTNAGFVVSRVMPITGLIGDPFLSCASASYSLNGWPLVGSVLTSARYPGGMPGALPDMRKIAPGIFGALGSNGPMVARRVPHAWLVVSGGKGMWQRVLVLRHLYTIINFR